MSVKIFGFTSGPAATNSWLVRDDAGHGVLIDAPPGSFAEVSAAIERENVTLGALILTHTHWDHTVDTALFRERFGTGMIVYVHKEDEYRLLAPMEHTIWPLPFTIEPFKADRHLDHGDTFTLGAIRFEVLHTPGHTEGSISLLDRESGIVFVGDVLFAGSVGRTDLPGGSFEVLSESIRTYLLPLPDDTQVLSGHGPITTIGEERETNPFIEP